MTFSEFMFGVFPYMCIIIAIVATTWRYVTDKFSYSSLSSQFLENRNLFWGSITWHYGILGVLTAHLVGFLIPSSILWWNMEPVRLYILETTGFVMGLMALVGLIVLIVRRFSSSRLKVVTSNMDKVLYIVLFTQVLTGVLIAVFYRWGSSWYAGFAAPYLWSIIELSPNVSLVENLPVTVQIHILNAFVFILLLPFTRLVHFLSVPIKYIWRPHQVVRWKQRKPVLGPF
ncbi:MAG: respiratory nitrate reductase subunit gamma [Proteobacteria bacterium]|nr:respiratory nitrate reductase subunit gamma [Pseudomonadota bacterium]